MNTWKDINPGDMPVGSRALADKIAALSLRCDHLWIDGDGTQEMTWIARGTNDGLVVFDGRGNSINEAVNDAIANLIGSEVSR